MTLKNAKFAEIISGIADMLESCDHQFELPWRGINSETWPMNATTGNYYQGINILNLLITQQVCNFTGNWATYRQWQAAERQVTKGSKGTPVLWASYVPVKDGKPDEVRPIWKHSTVFNECQLEDYVASAENHEPPEFDQSKLDFLMRFVDNVGVKRDTAPNAFYRMSNDTIYMPEKELFLKTADGAYGDENYGSTLLHELLHASGAEDRLDRLKDRDVAFEEIIAELGSVFLCAKLGVSNSVRENHIAYIKSWAKKIKDNPQYLIKAASQASKAVTFLMEQQTPDMLEEIAGLQAERQTSLAVTEYENAA